MFQVQTMFVRVMVREHCAVEFAGNNLTLPRIGEELDIPGVPGLLRVTAVEWQWAPQCANVTIRAER